MIYIIKPDIKKYKSFTINGKEARAKLGQDTTFHFDASPVSYLGDWTTMALEFSALAGARKVEMPDLIVRNGRLFLSKKAYEILHDTLGLDGEFLAVTTATDEKTAYLFNPLSVAEKVDGLDKKLSTRNQYGDLESISFIDNKVANFTVFRSEFDDYLSLYCQDSFKEKVEAAGLAGITFSEDLGTPYIIEDAENPVQH